jgi:hypothetical protein
MIWIKKIFVGVSILGDLLAIKKTKQLTISYFTNFNFRGCIGYNFKKRMKNYFITYSTIPLAKKALLF